MQLQRNTVLIFLFSSLIGKALSRGAGKVQFLSYNDHKDCGETCDFYFQDLKIVDDDGNTLKYIGSTDETLETDFVDLTQVPQLHNPFNIDFPTNSSVTIETTVMDEDSWGNPHDEIRTIKNFVIPFSEAWVGDDWKNAFTASSNPYMNFTVKYKLTSCDTYYGGAGCNTYCKEVSGNYTCDTRTGDKICVDTKTGYNCDVCINDRKSGRNCDVCVRHFAGTDCERCAIDYYPNTTCDVYCRPQPGRYNCSDQGTKVCQGNWNGTECDACKNNFYPADTCDTYCNPQAGVYTCNQTTGEKICHGNWTGTECDACNVNYFGPTCAKHCMETSNYTCNQTTGEKICINRNRAGVSCEDCVPNYYPVDRCNVFCVPQQDRFTCNDNGQRECSENYFGSDCNKFCKDSLEFHCDESGDKVCHDKTRTLNNDCSNNAQVISGRDIGLVVGGVLIVVFSIIIFLLIKIFQRTKKETIMEPQLEPQASENIPAISSVADKSSERVRMMTSSSLNDDITPEAAVLRASRGGIKSAETSSIWDFYKRLKLNMSKSKVSPLNNLEEGELCDTASIKSIRGPPESLGENNVNNKHPDFSCLTVRVELQKVTREVQYVNQVN